jgi:hypothetical protein
LLLHPFCILFLRFLNCLSTSFLYLFLLYLFILYRAE